MYCTQQEYKILMINNNFNSNTAVVIIRNHIDSKCYAQTPPRGPVSLNSPDDPAAESQNSRSLHNVYIQWGSMGKIKEDQWYIQYIRYTHTHIYIYSI